MTLKKSHPSALCAYFVCALALTVFTTDPYLAVLSLIGAILNLASLGGLKKGRALIAPLILFVLATLTNPLFSHRGETELLFINGRAITLEAIIAGAVTGCVFAAAMLICSSLTIALDDVKIMRLLGTHAPKCALVLSGALRFFPEMVRKHRAIEDAQKAIGRLPDEKPTERFRGIFRVWSALIGLAFEDAVEQARLIAASGFDENTRRRPMDNKKIGTGDILFIAVTLALTAFSLAPTFAGANQTVFYPTFSAERDLLAWISYPAALALFALPAVINFAGDLRESFAISRIRTQENKLFGDRDGYS